MIKSESLNKLYEEYIEEFKGNEIVLGEGNIDSRIVLIGEAPGKDEVAQGKPFVGKAGQNLNEFLEILGLDRDAIYITNSIKYRLFKINSDTGRKSNRPATKQEIEKNMSYLAKEISIINPKLVVTLGNVPLRTVTGDMRINIGDNHGMLSKIDILGNNCYIYPLYHPASIIYNVSLKDVYISDIKNLKEKMNKI